MELILIAYETPRLNDFEQFKNESREFDKELVEMCKNDGRKREDLYCFKNENYRQFFQRTLSK